MLARAIECLCTDFNTDAVMNGIKISNRDGFALAKRVHDNKAEFSDSLYWPSAVEMEIGNLSVIAVYQL